MKFSNPLLLLTLLITTTMATEKLIYTNPLSSPSSIANWTAEGPVQATFNNTSSSNSSSLELFGTSDFVFWCDQVFPDRIRVSWEFSPVSEPGLAILFFGAAASSDGGSIFDPSLAVRNGSYPQYHSSDIRTLHVSYFRRRWEEERAFHTANLRKSPGFHLVAQGADPLPSVVDSRNDFYRIELVKDGGDITFSINELKIFEWSDQKSNSSDTGPVVGGGRIGFRQMNPLVARYRNLKVWELL